MDMLLSTGIRFKSHQSQHYMYLHLLEGVLNPNGLGGFDEIFINCEQL